MTYLRDVFTKHTPYCTAVRIANGQRIWSEGKGNISIEIDSIIIRMTDVLFVPRLDANLLSIPALNRKGLSVLFRQDGVEILRHSTSVATGFLRGRTNFLKSSQVALKALTETPATAITSDNDFSSEKETRKSTSEAKYQLWHARMGHPSPKHLRELHHFASGFAYSHQPSLIYLALFAILQN